MKKERKDAKDAATTRIEMLAVAYALAFVLTPSLQNATIAAVTVPAKAASAGCPRASR